MNSQIIEHKQIERVLDYLDREATHDHTLVVFDIDNTLLEPQEMVTSTEWFEHSITKMLKQGMEYQAACKELFDFCSDIQESITMRCIEPSTQRVVEQAHKLGAQGLGLTGRSPAQAEKTVEQLVGFDLALNNTFLHNRQALLPVDKPYQYHGGIVFCYFYCKGQALTEIFTHLEYRPEKVVFIDDLLKNVQMVGQALTAFDSTIQFTGIHYSRLAHKRVLFDPAIAEREYEVIRAKKVSGEGKGK